MTAGGNDASSADGLQEAVALVGAFDAERASERDAFKQCLTRVRANLKRASDLWQQSKDAPGEDAGPFTTVIAIGPECARALHALHLENREYVSELSTISGVMLSDTMGILAEELDVVRAYDEPVPEESLEQRIARAQVDLAQRMQRVDEAIKVL